MEIKICDTCKTKVKHLNELASEYKSDDIVHICDTCLREFNDLLMNVIKAQTIQRTNFMRRFMRRILSSKTK